MGETVNFTNTDGNLVATVSNNGINYDLAENIDLGATGSVLTGNTRVNNAGITVTGGTNDTVLLSRNGLNNGNNVITNVANGVAATDAATFGQLSTTNTNVATNTSNIANVRAQANRGFNISADNSDLVNNETVDNVQLGETVDFTNTDGNLVATVSNNGINYDLADDISVDSITADDGNGNVTTLNAMGTNVTDGTNSSDYTANGFSTTYGTNTTTFNQAGLSFTDVNGATGPSITAAGIDAGDTVISNLRPGSIAAGSKDAVTGDQLNTTNTNVTNNTNDIDDINAGRSGIVRQDAGTGAITVGAATGGTSVNFANSTGGARTLSGVANGSIAANSKEAINGGQVNTLVTQVTNQFTATNANVTDNTNRSTGNLAALGGGAAYNATNNTYTQPIYTLDDGSNTGTNVTANNVGGALDNLDGRTTTNTSNIANVQAQANQGFNISANNGTADNVQLGETVNFTNTDGNLVATVSDNGINYDLAENIDLGVNGSVRTGNTVTNNAGVRIDDGTGNITAVTATGTNVTDGNGNTGRYNAGSTVLTDDSGNTNASAAIGNAILDDQGNANLSGAIGNALFDQAGNANLSGAQGNVVFDNAGNRTTTSATGTNVTDGTNTSNYDANGLTATDVNGNSTLVNQTGLSFTNDLGDATGPSITASGINAGGSKITNIDDGTVAANSKDAVNGGQLFATNEAITAKTDALGNSTATNLGGTATYDATTGAVSAPVYSLDDGSNTGTNVTANSVGGALDNLNTRTKTNTGDIANLNTRVDGIDFPIRSSNAQSFTTSATGIDALAVGSNANANGIGVTAIGEGARANGIYATSIGQNASADSISATAIGQNARADSINATAIGQDASANSISATAIGQDASANSINATAIGQNASANSINATSIGVNTSSDINGFAGGQGASAGMNSVALGSQSTANAIDSIAIGSSSSATVIGGVALGQNSVANVEGGATGFIPTAALIADQNAINATNSTNLGAVSVGTGAVGGNRQIVNVAAGTNDSDAVNVSQLKAVDTKVNQGIKFNVDGGERTYALGETIGVTTDSNIITSATTDGVNFAINPDLVLDSVTTGNTVTNNAGVRIDDGTGNITAVTATGTNVTDGNGNTGRYNAGSTVLTDDSGNTNASAAIGNAILDDQGNANLSGAIGNALFDQAGNANLSGAQGNVVFDNAGNRTTTSATGTNVTDGTNTSNYDANGLTATDVNGNSTLVNQTGLSFTNDLGDATGPSITAAGINAGGSAISNVADGVATTDVATIGQLQASNNAADAKTDALGNSTATNLGGGASYTAATGIVSAPTYTLNDGTNTGTTADFDNVGGALDNLDGRTTTNTSNIANVQAQANQGFNISADNGTADNVQLGETVNFTNTDGNLVATVSDNGINYDLAENIDLGVNGSVRTGNTVTNNAGVRIDDGTGNITAVTATGTNVTDGNGNTGRYNAGSTILTDDSGNINASAAIGNAILDDQGNANLSGAIGNALFDQAGNANLSGAQGNVVFDNAGNRTTTSATGTNVTDGTNTSNYDANGLTATDVNGNSTLVNQTGLSFTNDLGDATGPSITAAGINAGGSAISNVADGVATTDVATIGQLQASNNAADAKTDALGNSTVTNLGGGASYTAATGVVSAPTYTLNDGTNTGTTADFDNVGGALDNLDGRTTTNTSNIANAVGDATNGIYRQVTGVAAGTADSDAVNVSQLKAVSDTLQNNNEALSNAAVQYDKNADGTVNKGSITLGGGAAGTTITNVAAGNVSAGSTDAVNGSQLHNLGNGVASIIGGDAALDASGNLTASNIGGTGKGNINDAIAAVNQGNAQANENIQANTDRLDAGLSFGADSGTTINKPIGDTTALNFEGGNNITTTATSSGIKFDLNGNIDVDNITADTVTTGNTTVSNSGVTIKDGPSMTTAGINAGNKTITGVADGIEVNDAVNLGQLSALDNKLSNSVNELGYKINEVEDDANAGVSAAMAMSSLPQAYIPGKSMVGGGIATYNGQSAVAIGVSKVSDNGRWVIKVNGTADTQGNAGGAVGAGFHF